MNKQLLIAGGTGLIGSALKSKAIAAGWDVTVLSRKLVTDGIIWDPSKKMIDLPGKMKFDAIVNLAGSSLSEGRWTSERKEDIIESRSNACKTLENYLFDGRLSTDVYIGASAIGIYGDAGLDEVNERTPVKKKDWFSGIVIDWEKCHKKIASLEIRTVIIRTGIVLSLNGGALSEILKSTRFGILPQFGNGRQMWSWIHIHDLADLMLYCIDNSKLAGTFLGTSPNPVPNREVIQTVNNYLPSRKIILPVPQFLLKIMLGEMHRVVFDSCSAPSDKIVKAGFKFEFNTIQEACKDLFKATAKTRFY